MLNKTQMIIKRLKLKYMNELSKVKQGNEVNTLLAYHSIHTTCKCGKNAELKYNGQWFENKCECGTNIRMNRNKSKMIVEAV
jgi:hypothetical protein